MSRQLDGGRLAYLQILCDAAMAVTCATGVGVLTERPASIYTLGSRAWRLWAALLWIRHAVTRGSYVAPARLRVRR